MEASFRRIGLNSVGVDESGLRNDQIQNPMPLVTVALDTLIVTKDSHAATDTVVIYVNVVSSKETDGSVDCFKRRQCDGD